MTDRALLARRALMSGTAVSLVGAWQAAAAERHPTSKKGAKNEPAPLGGTAQTPVGPLDIAAKWGVVIDFATGATLLDKDADLAIPPSSMTKLMTAYIVYDRLKQGRLKLDDEFPVSERAWRMGGSKMFVQLGTSVKVEDLIRGMIVQSGNDACIVLAEGLAGSEEGFVDLMNADRPRSSA